MEQESVFLSHPQDNVEESPEVMESGDAEKAQFGAGVTAVATIGKGVHVQVPTLAKAVPGVFDVSTVPTGFDKLETVPTVAPVVTPLNTA